jgi:hypothetical protein
MVASSAASILGSTLLRCGSGVAYATDMADIHRIRRCAANGAVAAVFAAD